MLFSNLYKSPLAKLRLHQSSTELKSPPMAGLPNWHGKEYADLLSRDKTRQKEAVKKYLKVRVRNDWEFQWPPGVAAANPASSTVQSRPLAGVMREEMVEPTAAEPTVQDETRDDDGYQVEDDPADLLAMDDDCASVYTVESEDAAHYRPRLEWESDFSDEEPIPSPKSSLARHSDALSTRVIDSVEARRAHRRRALREEMKWNQGLACFEARRNAWTAARTVRLRPMSAAPAVAPTSPRGGSPRSPRRFFTRRSFSGLPPSPSPSSQRHSGEGSVVTSDTSSLARDTDRDLSHQQTKDTALSTSSATGMDYPVKTLVPIAPPILPPNNTLRMSITPAAYPNLYDKVIVHNMQPACPINLADMLRACVVGWKRDGEWPPRNPPTLIVESVIAARKKKPAAAPNAANDRSVSPGSRGRSRRMSLGLLGRDKEDEASRAGKGIRKSLQRAFGLGSPEQV